jgi:hypothetical protein
VIRIVGGSDGGPNFEASVGGIAIYLDNFAIKTLAKGDPALRGRFVAALNDGADLLFSVANAAEISGPQGASSVAIKEFLDELGAHWYPVELVLDTVIKREAAGHPPGRCCFSEELLRAYFLTRIDDHSLGSGKVVDLSESFFRLGAFVDWLAPQRSWFLDKGREFDIDVKDKIRLLRARLKRDPRFLDSALPQPLFDPLRAATFVHVWLMRALICDSGFQIRRGDGIDFHHAVIASAFANFSALDKQWKMRVENLPKPNTLSKIYYEPELNVMVADIEAALRQLKTSGVASESERNPRNAELQNG